jgi:glycosyltransferase involved in cell wall biosynthesis
MSVTGGEPFKVVIVSFQYWPALSARSFRWTALAERWASEGSEVHVVCAGSSARPAAETVNRVHVHRVGSAWIERLRASQAASSPATATAPGVIKRAAGAAARSIWHAIYWPDTSCTWYWAARRKARELVAEVGPTALVSVSPTFTAVAVGRALRRSGDHRFRWLIDLGDPFSFSEEAPPNNFRLYRRLNLAFERACFADADCVSVTTPETRERYAALFPESASKIAVIPPLLALPDTAGPAAGETSARRSLVFLGRLYPTIRRPDFLLKLFAALVEAQPGEGYELHFYGETRECEASFVRYAHLMGRSIHVHGSVSRERAAAAMRSADVLVNLGNDTRYQLPSKIVEYSTTGKPILNLARYPDDSSARFLADYPAHLTLLAREEGPAAEDAAKLRAFLLRPPQPIAQELLRARLAAYALPQVSARYSALLSG